MKHKSESYPDRIRHIAVELSRLPGDYEVDHTVEKLRIIAEELERNLHKAAMKKKGRMS